MYVLYTDHGRSIAFFFHIVLSVISVALPFADSCKLFELKTIAVQILLLCVALSDVD